MSTPDAKNYNADNRLTARAGEIHDEQVRAGETQLDLNPATLLFHNPEESTDKIIIPAVRPLKQRIDEMTIGPDAFAIRKNTVASLLEASYRTIDTAFGQFSLWADDHDLSYIQRLNRRIAELEKKNAVLESQVNSDALTGLLNRRGLESVLARELSYSRRTGNHLLAALIDLDNFKAFNDTYGHHVGDEVLRCVAQVMKEKIRVSDWSSRVGGDEFLILLPSTTLDQGFNVLDRVRISICDRTIVAARDLFLHTSVSIGIARLESDIVTLEDVLSVTTKVLKRSKRDGKNRISMALDAESAENRLIDEVVEGSLSIEAAALLDRGEVLAAADASRRQERC